MRVARLALPTDSRLTSLWALSLCRTAAITSALVLIGACGSRASNQRPTQPIPVADGIHLGDCADPSVDGVLGDDAEFIRSDRDLNGDGVDEVVVADRDLCTAEGNCHWNLFRVHDGCHRYLGTISAARMRRMSGRSDDGFHDLRTWWHLTSGERALLQEYRFRRGGYHITDVLLCRPQGDDRIICDEMKAPIAAD